MPSQLSSKPYCRCLKRILLLQVLLQQRLYQLLHRLEQLVLGQKMPVGMLVNKKPAIAKSKAGTPILYFSFMGFGGFVLLLRQTYCLNFSKFARVGRRTAKEAGPDLLKFSNH